MNISTSAFAEFLSRVGRLGIFVAMFAYFIRSLGTPSFGSFVLFEATAIGLGVFVDIGLGSAVQKRTGESQSRAVLASALAVKIVMLSLVTMGVWFFADALNGFIGRPLAVFLPAAIAAQQFGRLGLHAVRGEDRLVWASGIQLAGDVVHLATALTLDIVAGMGVMGLVLGFVTGWGFVTVATGGLLRFVPVRPDPMVLRSLFRFSPYAFLSSVLGGLVYNWTDTLIIGWFLGPGPVTVYETAWRVSGLMVLGAQAVSTVAFPKVSRWHAADRLDRVEGIFPYLVSAALFMVIPGIAGGYVLGPEVLSVVFGLAAPSGPLVLLVLLIGKLPESVSKVVSRTLYGLNRPEYTSLGAAAFIAINVVLNVILVMAFGMVGAAIATTVAFLVNLAINARYLRRHVSVSIVWRHLAIMGAASLVMGGALLLLGGVLPPQGAPRLIASVLIGAIVYAMVVAVPRSMRRDIKALVDNIA